MPDLYGHLTPQGVLNGSLQTIVYVNNYNDLINKPSINSVELQGNKTASELGLVTPATEAVQSVNGETGAVVLDGSDIRYDSDYTVSAKIAAVEDAIPVVSYPVTSVNSKTGAVVLDDSDIEHSSGVSVNSLINTIMNYTPVYGNTASGAIATFDTSLALPLQDCTIAINAVQESGTPTPSSPKAISGFDNGVVTRCGKNLFSYDLTIRNGYWADNAFVGDNAIVPKISAVTWQYIRVYVEGLSSITLSGFDNQGGTNCAWLSSENVNDVISRFNSSNKNETKIVPSGAKYLCLTIFNIKDKLTTCPNAQLEIGNQATTFEAYNGTTYPITWQSEAGTVYGGSLDVTTGVLTITHAYNDLGTLTWLQDSTYGSYFYTTGFSNKKSGLTNMICNKYANATEYGNRQPDLTIRGTESGNVHRLFIRDNSCADITAFNTAIQGAMLCYEIEMPQTVQLTPTQISAIVGNNNVFTDTNGNTSVVYACSLKDYIDSQ